MNFYPYCSHQPYKMQQQGEGGKNVPSNQMRQQQQQMSSHQMQPQPQQPQQQQMPHGSGGGPLPVMMQQQPRIPNVTVHNFPQYFSRLPENLKVRFDGMELEEKIQQLQKLFEMNARKHLMHLQQQQQMRLNNGEFPPQPQHNLSKVIANYYIPSGYFIKSCCDQLGLEYDNNQYLEFLAKIKFSEIKSTSKPSSCLQSTTDKTGFSCFSMIFCGKDDPKITDKIKQAINKLFYRRNSGITDTEKMESVIFSSILTVDHIKFIVKHFNFRILVYFNEEWKKFGDFGSDGTPLFLLEKKVAQDGINYQIVLSLED